MPVASCASPIEVIPVETVSETLDVSVESVSVPRMDECPQGGNHNWTYSGHIRTCTKCGTSENAQ